MNGLCLLFEEELRDHVIMKFHTFVKPIYKVIEVTILENHNVLVQDITGHGG